MREGLLDSSKRGVWSLTERGRSTTLSPQQAGEVFQKWTRIFQEQKRAKDAKPETREEAIAESAGAASNDYRAATLTLLSKLSAKGFERLAQRLLREAGFTQVVVTGRSGDGGIDGYGTVLVNKLVTFKVLFQCKRYNNTNPVVPKDVRDFRGAMSGRADKGIFITTGTFTAEARREATRDGVPPIELLDGEKLVDMLGELELGLRRITTYEIDSAFFKEFES